MEEKGHCLLFHGGGVTGILQPNDTHVHEPLSKEIKRLEQIDVCEQRRLQPGKIPRRTRQKVYDDCHLAWDSIDHDYVGPKSHLQDGWTLPLDGSQDDEIYHDLEPIWNSPALDMFTVRDKLAKEVNRDIDDGIYTDWSQWPELLEEFPPHSSMVEGQEGHGHRDRADGEGGGGDDDADPDDDDDGEAGSDDDDSDGPGGGEDAGEGEEVDDDEEGSDDEDLDDGDDGVDEEEADEDFDDGAAGSEAGAADAAAAAPSSGAAPPAAPASAPGLGSGVVEPELEADVGDTEIKVRTYVRTYVLICSSRGLISSQYRSHYRYLRLSPLSTFSERRTCPMQGSSR